MVTTIVKNKINSLGGGSNHQNSHKKSWKQEDLSYRGEDWGHTFGTRRLKRFK